MDKSGVMANQQKNLLQIKFQVQISLFFGLTFFNLIYKLLSFKNNFLFSHFLIKLFKITLEIKETNTLNLIRDTHHGNKQSSKPE